MYLNLRVRWVKVMQDQSAHQQAGTQNDDQIEAVRTAVNAPAAADAAGLQSAAASSAAPSASPPAQTPPAQTIQPSAPFTMDAGTFARLLQGVDPDTLQYILDFLPAEALMRALHRRQSALAPQAAAAEASQVVPAEAPQMPAAEEQPDANSDQRHAPRNRTLRAGKIVYNNHSNVASCTIRDMSETGCRISVPSTTLIPNQFILQINNQTAPVNCTVAWRTADQLGVRFMK
jgi:hypothetical protein